MSSSTLLSALTTLMVAVPVGATGAHGAFALAAYADRLSTRDRVRCWVAVGIMAGWMLWNLGKVIAALVRAWRGAAHPASMASTRRTTRSCCAGCPAG